MATFSPWPAFGSACGSIARSCRTEDGQAATIEIEMPELEHTCHRVSSWTRRSRRAGFWLWPLLLFLLAPAARAGEPVQYRERSMRDVLRHLVRWSADHRRPFRIDELPGIFEQATGVDTREIFERWMKPLPSQ